VRRRVHEQGGGRRNHRMAVLPGRRLPLRQALDGGAVVRREAAYDDVVVADEAGQAVGRDVDAAVRGVVVVNDVTEHRVAGRAVLDVEGPAGVGGHDDSVVGDEVVLRPVGSVDLVQGDAAGVVVVEHVVLDDGVLHAVAIDAGAAAGAVVVDDVANDHRAGDDAAAALAHVAVEVDAAIGVAEDDVVADGRRDGAIGHVDAVLALRVAGGVVLDVEVVAEAAEDAPVAVLVGDVVGDRHVVIGDGADAGARHAADGEAVDGDVAGAFEVDAVLGDAVGLVDDHAGEGLEGDRGGGRAAGGQIETFIGAGLDDNGVAGSDGVGGA